MNRSIIYAAWADDEIEVLGVPAGALGRCSRGVAGVGNGDVARLGGLYDLHAVQAARNGERLRKSPHLPVHFECEGLVVPPVHRDEREDEFGLLALAAPADLVVPAGGIAHRGLALAGLEVAGAPREALLVAGAPVRDAGVVLDVATGTGDRHALVVLARLLRGAFEVEGACQNAEPWRRALRHLPDVARQLLGDLHIVVPGGLGGGERRREGGPLLNSDGRGVARGAHRDPVPTLDEH